MRRVTCSGHKPQPRLERLAFWLVGCLRLGREEVPLDRALFFENFMNKICTKCQTSKSPHEFHKNRTSKDGLQRWCRASVNALPRESMWCQAGSRA